jgi:hypothetical protein
MRICAVPRRVLQVRDQPQDLRLDGDVEGRRRLVGDDDLGVAGKGEGDHGALAHAARKLVRELPGAPLGIGHLHQRQGFDGAVMGFAPRAPAVLAHGFGDLLADAQHRVQRRQRLLEDHGDLFAAPVLDLPLAHRKEIGSLDENPSRHHVRRFGEQSQQRKRRHRLAAAAFAHDAERLAGPDGERHFRDDRKRPVGAADLDVEPFDREGWLIGAGAGNGHVVVP